MIRLRKNWYDPYMSVFGHILRDIITTWWITWTAILDYGIVATGLSQGTGG